MRSTWILERECAPHAPASPDAALVALLTERAEAASESAHPGASRRWAEVARCHAFGDDDEAYAHALFRQYWSTADEPGLVRPWRSSRSRT